MIDADYHDVSELAQASAVVRVRLDGGAIRESASVHPNHDGFPYGGSGVLRPYVQILAVLVLDPKTMRKNQFVGADRAMHGNRADWAPGLSVPDSLPGLNRLGLAKPFRFRVANSQERVRLSLPEATELSTLYRDHRRAQVRAGRGWQSFGVGARCPLFLRERTAR